MGILAARLLYGRTRGLRDARDPVEVRARPVFNVLANRYYLDNLYHQTVVRGTLGLASAFAWIDRRVVDGCLHAIGRLGLAGAAVNRWVDEAILNRGFFDRSCRGINATGGRLRLVQTGKIQDYLAYLTAGAVMLIVAWLVIRF